MVVGEISRLGRVFENYGMGYVVRDFRREVGVGGFCLWRFF